MNKKGRQFLTKDGKIYIHEAVHTYSKGDPLIACYEKGTKNGVYVLPREVVKYLPTKYELFLGYISLAIPSAMFARVVRKITGEKGTPLENFLMEYYFKMEDKLLKGKL